ncbi:hypothetical protein AWZ03_009421 [Drosophila navojoa]|uniref:Gustatory receptor n=1 Tax=Drosophila navojoa TaxID=7232 RepID=A0A484B672_DRONA|nr:uncharacterized protein LOC108650166 [Drosophila navojoa]TDG44144.1 hypothetical protein AWZ03_009421 [Drosophila navojoa]
MWRFNLLFILLKVQCLILDVVGLLKLRFDRAHQRYRLRRGCCSSFLMPFPCLLLILLNIIQFLLRCKTEHMNATYNEVAPGTRPDLDVVDFFMLLARNIIYVWMLIMCLTGRLQLWYMVDQAQLVYRHLESVLRERLQLKCSWLLLFLGIFQLLLLLWLSFSLLFLNFPLTMGENLIHYGMGAMDLLLVLLLTVNIYQLLLHTAVLQSLNQLLRQLQLQQPNELNLLRQVLQVCPLLKRIQHLAAFYFRLAFCWLFCQLCLKCGAYVSEFSYEEDVILSRHKSIDHLEEEAEWLGQESPPQTRDHALIFAAFELAGTLTMMLPLLFTAKLQQREQKKLMNNIWKIELPSSKQQVAPRSFSERRDCKDIIGFLLSTRLPFVDYRPHSVSILAWKPRPNAAVITFAGIASGCKMLLQVVLCTTVVDYLQQVELDRLQSRS